MEFTRDELELIRQLVQAYVAWLYANGLDSLSAQDNVL